MAGEGYVNLLLILPSRFPLSASDIYNNVYASANFAIDCSRIVLPVPKNPPGKTDVPAFASGKQKPSPLNCDKRL